MTLELDPREIPILTDAIDEGGGSYGVFDAKAVHAAILTETLKLTDSLLHQALKDIEATVFEQVFGQLRARLPELIDRALKENAGISSAVARDAYPAVPASVGAEPAGPAPTDLKPDFRP
jgi:hypothetical protein